MKKQALKFVDSQKDSLRIYRFCKECALLIESVGIQKGWEESEAIVI